MGLRYAALGLAIALAILAMVWPFRVPKAPRSRALLSYFLSLCLGIVTILLAPLGHGTTVPFFGTMTLVA